jgi:hypothetical protein
VGKIHDLFRQVSHFSLLGVCWLLPESSGG